MDDPVIMVQSEEIKIQVKALVDDSLEYQKKKDGRVELPAIIQYTERPGCSPAFIVTGNVPDDLQGVHGIYSVDEESYYDSQFRFEAHNAEFMLMWWNLEGIYAITKHWYKTPLLLSREQGTFRSPPKHSEQYYGTPDGEWVKREDYIFYDLKIERVFLDEGSKEW